MRGEPRANGQLLQSHIRILQSCAVGNAERDDLQGPGGKLLRTQARRLNEVVKVERSELRVPGAGGQFLWPRVGSCSDMCAGTEAKGLAWLVHRG